MSQTEIIMRKFIDAISAREKASSAFDLNPSHAAWDDLIASDDYLDRLFIQYPITGRLFQPTIQPAKHNKE